MLFSLINISASMKRYSENDVFEAMAEVEQGSSIRVAARKWGVPKATLQDRIRGVKSQRELTATLQKLSLTQEDGLEAWILAQEALGFPPTHREIVYILGQVLHVFGQPTTLGKR